MEWNFEKREINKKKKRKMKKTETIHFHILLYAGI